MDNWQKITDAIKAIRLKKIRAIPILGKTEEEIMFLETLSSVEVDYAIWGCQTMEYTMRRSNQFIKWKQKNL